MHVLVRSVYVIIIHCFFVRRKNREVHVYTNFYLACRYMSMCLFPHCVDGSHCVCARLCVCVCVGECDTSFFSPIFHVHIERNKNQSDICGVSLHGLLGCWFFHAKGSIQDGRLLCLYCVLKKKGELAVQRKANWLTH